MSTQIEIEECLRRLVCESGYEKLTVSDICKEAHISRKTFYEYFHGKEDVVRSYFARTVLDPLRFLHETLGYLSAEDLMKTQCPNIYHSISKDREFYTRLIGEGLGDTGGAFVRSATEAIREYNNEAMGRMGGKSLQGWKRDYASYFFASSQAMLMKRWILDGFTPSPAELGEFYIQLTSGFWLSLNKSN